MITTVRDIVLLVESILKKAHDEPPLAVNVRPDGWDFHVEVLVESLPSLQVAAIIRAELRNECAAGTESAVQFTQAIAYATHHR